MVPAGKVARKAFTVNVNDLPVSLAIDMFLAEADLTVYEITSAGGSHVLRSLTTHYTTTGVGVEAGGTIALTALTGGAGTASTVIVIQNPATAQSTDMVKNTAHVGSNTEGMVDELTLKVLALEQEIKRCIKLPLVENPADQGVDITSRKADRASKNISFDSSGNLTLTS